jgi:hypothetical protein
LHSPAKHKRKFKGENSSQKLTDYFIKPNTRLNNICAVQGVPKAVNVFMNK